MNQEQARLHIMGMRLPVNRKVYVHGDPLTLLKISKSAAHEAITQMDIFCYRGPYERIAHT
jgi:hypothetical protein